MRYHFFGKGKRKKVEPVDGIKFDSQGERKRYLDLKLLQKAGKIRSVEVHPIYILEAGFIDAMGKAHRPIIFTPDFRYWDCEKCKVIVEDWKPVITYYTKKKRIKKTKFMTNDAYPLRKTLFLKKCLMKDMEFHEVGD